MRPGFKRLDQSMGAVLMAFFSWLPLAVNADRAAAEQNLRRIDLPKGFKIEVFAEVPGARSMAFGQSMGHVFVGTMGGAVYAVIDKNKDRKADEVRELISDLKVPNGVAMHRGALYVAEQHRIARYPAPGFSLDLPWEENRQVIFDRLPDKRHHGWRYIGFGPDGNLYVTVGSPCNICDPKGIEGTIIRMNPDGSAMEVYAKGIRHSVGFDFQPNTGTLYFTDNNTDWMGDDTPPGELNRAPEPGLHFGFPYYAGGSVRHPEWANKRPPQPVTMPAIEFQAHVAPLGVRFYTGAMFPEEYRHDAFVAQHGSWNRSIPVGYRIMRIKFDTDGKAVDKEIFADGWLQQNEAWGRPVDILELPDGSLLVSDDYQGMIYRIRYEGQDNPATKRTVTGFKNPESAVVGPDGRVYVSEIGAFDQDGDGRILVLDEKGEPQVFADGLDDPKGLAVREGQLLVTDKTRVLSIDPKGRVRVLVDADAFPRRPQFLNDIVVAGDGAIYVSDSGDLKGQGGMVYRIATDKRITEMLSAGEAVRPKAPNGLLWEDPDKLLVVDYATGALYRIDSHTAAAERVNGGFGSGDGLARDAEHRLYVSDVKKGRLFQLDTPYAKPRLVSDDFVSAADIASGPDGRTLLVPDMKAGALVFLPLP